MQSLFDQFASQHFEQVHKDTQAMAVLSDSRVVPCIIDAYDVENRIDQTMSEASVRFRKQDVGGLIQPEHGRRALRSFTFESERNGTVFAYSAKSILGADAYSITLLCKVDPKEVLKD